LIRGSKCIWTAARFATYTSLVSSPADLIQNSPCGLSIAGADCFIDAWRAVDRTIVTHAHSDHARRGSKRYLCATEGAPLLRARMNPDAIIDTVEYGEPVDINGVIISLHPAGHVRGSAQVRVERGGEVWVVTGDYKLQPDPTTTPFELVRCHTFITECTFGLPIFRWAGTAIPMAQLHAWWQHNQSIGRTSIVLAYSLGKAQRILSLLDPSIGPILLHGAIATMTDAYRASGCNLPPTEHASLENAKKHRGKALVIAPQSAMNSPWARKFGASSVGSASGWMSVRGFRRRGGIDRGFVISDHVDWPGLLDTVAATGASRVIATHGYTGVVSRYFQERGLQTGEFATRFGGEEEESPAADGENAALPCEEDIGQDQAGTSTSAHAEGSESAQAEATP
jgi:putative mRNA 3-end processing factor